jgi:hypothetical protein
VWIVPKNGSEQSLSPRGQTTGRTRNSLSSSLLLRNGRGMVFPCQQTGIKPQTVSMSILLPLRARTFLHTSARFETSHRSPLITSCGCTPNNPCHLARKG